MSMCVGGGIRWVLAGRKWRTLRFGYEQLESIERGCRREGKKKKSRVKTWECGAGDRDGRRAESDARGVRIKPGQKEREM